MCRSNKTEMFRFETANFVIRATVEPDTDPDFAFDETGETADKVASGEWQCFVTNVTVSHKAIELGTDSLSGSIYANPADFFREHYGIAAKSRADGCNYGCYFPDMIREAIGEARKALASMPKVRAT